MSLDTIFSLVQTALELGLISALTVLALFLSYSMLNVCDLSTDGCFTLGATVGAAVAIAGHPYLSLPAAMAAGMLSGFITALLQTKMGVNSLLAGIIVNTALYSVNIAVMGNASVLNMNKTETVFTKMRALLEHTALAGQYRLIVAAVAALREYPAPLMIIDMGTATTISVIDASRTYIGGCICPGVRISADALTTRAALLPGINLDEPKRAIGRNTIDCMRSGIMLGAAAMLDGLIDRMEEELGQQATVVATGGIAKFVIPLCRRSVIYDRNLLLKGLSILYYNNQK